ncbi:MAG: glycosyltransferase family 4 protein [Alphaproteobacteria bacterium]|nr:MAG: glycosyltransferase family 4 protein [Alphaproteobacteria bacterium]
MLRMLTLSTLFPNALQPTLGVFVERQTLGLAARDGVEVEVVSPVGMPPWPLSLHPHYRRREALPEREIWKGLNVHRPRFPVLPRVDALSARAMAGALLPLLRDIRRRFEFDVIDAEFFWPDGPAAMRLARALGVPFSVKARGSDIHQWTRRRGVGGQILRAGTEAGGLLAVSAAMKADMVRLGMPEERIAVHYTGVDQERFHPVDRAAAKAALGVDGPLIVTAGALLPRKQPLLSVAVAERIPEATLILVGEGPERGALEAMAAPLGGRVRLLGNRPHEELPAYLAAADVLLHPSTAEGLANVWVEALACGTPIVITGAGGAREVVDRPEAGRIAAPEADALAAAVRELVASPPPQEKVREAASRFTWERNSETLAEHLAGLVKRH